MKKHISYLIVGLFIVSMMGTAASTHLIKNAEPQQLSSLSEATHTVLVEEVSTQACGYCPTASEQLYSIYNAGDLDFYFVTLLPDVSKYIWSRVEELGTTGVPDVHFDGGYRNLVGAQDDEGAYRNAITASGDRAVPDIDVSVSVEFKGGGTLKLSVNIQNNEDEEFNGHIRIYIVEPESRWDDASRVPFHFAAIAMPVDRSLAVPKSNLQACGDTYTITRTWFGALYDYADITEDNIMVIASVFDTNTNLCVETAAAQPTAQSSPQPPFPLMRGILLDFILQLRTLLQT